MAATLLPAPRLTQTHAGTLPIITDDALFAASSVRVAFTMRAGGMSPVPYDSLNLGFHVGDDPACVQANRRTLMAAFNAESLPLITPKQVHGTDIVHIKDAKAATLAAASERAACGADGLVVDAVGVAALLCFADCVPVVIVAPSGRFAVVHAGWRGALARIASKAARMLAQAEAKAHAELAECDVVDRKVVAREATERGVTEGEVTERGSAESEPAEREAAEYEAAECEPAKRGAAEHEAAEREAAEYEAARTLNAYIGPHICAQCFETSTDVRDSFVDVFGTSCAPDSCHVDLSAAIACDLCSAGLDMARIACSDACTACAPDKYFSYRASGGTCGRQGALVFRAESEACCGNC